MLYSFGPFRADRAAYQAYRGDRSLDLTPKLLDLLFYLVERPATLVTKEELLDGVWPGANVTENALAQAISDLREALGDSPAAPAYIRTVARRGYRFVAAVQHVDRAPSRAADVPPAPSAEPARTTQPSPAAVDTATVAVPDFANVTGDPDVSWLASGIAETVTSDLVALERFRVIDRWRVVQASRTLNTTSSASMHDLGAALGATLIVTGSFQRSGQHLRITARLINIATGDAVADAKVDGDLDDIFALEDGIVTAFAAELGLPSPAAGTGAARETSSLDAYRAYSEGWLKIESLDTGLIRQSMTDFERAVELDPDYAIALTGLANAEFVAYEMTRLSERPDLAARASGIEHARRAIRLDDRLAEAHATLSFLLASAAAFDDARAAAERAVALEPDSWRHYYRLGHATWGQARLRALERALSLYPGFSYAQFETAMVHVARGRLELAAGVARSGVGEQDRHARSANRFPAIGFHWLSGALAAADGRCAAAIDAFDRELALVDRRRLYGPEYGATALVARGHAELSLGRPEDARKSFHAALDYLPDFVRARVGEAMAMQTLGKDADAAWSGVRQGEERLARTDRLAESLLIAACRAAATGQPEQAASHLNELLNRIPPSVAGWFIPIEPCFRALQARPDFQGVLQRLAERAK